MVKAERNGMIDGGSVYRFCRCKEGDVITGFTDLLSSLGDSFVYQLVIILDVSE